MSAPDVVRLVDLRAQPLAVGEVVDVLDDPRSGALALFVGRVRDHDGGRGVRALDYSAHPSAGDRLREVAAGVAARHQVLAVAAVHRVGSLVVGDLAVVVGVAAAHRAEAFAACRDLLDTLKTQVPVWKHQHYDDGDADWLGAP